jgi:molecular chaperone GrpE
VTEKDEAERGDRPAPKVKVTDRRRVREEGGPPSGSPSSDASESAVGAATGTAGGPSRGGPAAEEQAASRSELEAARREASEYRDHLMRLQAEFENYRKRVLREQTQAIEMASEPLVRRLLEVLDEFELALMAAEQKPDFEKFLRGVELVYAKLVDTLRGEGLERIEAEGKPFNPELHEALMGSGAGDGEPVVADVLRQGYTLRGRVIRPAGVRVTHES